MPMSQGPDGAVRRNRLSLLLARLAAACLGAAVLLASGCGQQQECLTNRQFFAQKVWGQVMSKICVKCHSPEGVAADQNAKLMLLTSSYPAFLDTNLATVTDVSKIQYDGTSELLLKPTGNLMHGGGMQIAKDGDEYKILAEFVQRTSKPVECPGVSDSTAAAQNIVLLAPAETLRKASLAIAGRLPTDQEIETVKTGGEPALSAAIDSLMSEETFFVRVKEIWNDVLLTNRYYGRGLDLLNDQDYPNKYWWNPRNVGDDKLTDEQRNQRWYSTVGISSEPLELIAYVIRNNRPFTEILTADYTVVNPYSARVYGLDPATLGFTDAYAPYEFRQAKVSITRNGMSLPLPHAGVLTQNVFLSRYPTTETNLNRHRARMTFKFFLATDLLKVAERPIDPSSVTSLNPTRDDPYCKVCHKIIDPVAGTYQKFDDGGRFVPDATWPAALPQPGFGQRAIDNVMQYPNALQWLAARLTADQRFVVAATQTMYRGLTGHDPLEYPADGDPSFNAHLAAWQAQDTTFLAIGDAFVKNSFNLKTLVRSLVLSPAFRADNAAGGNPLELEGYGTGRILPPEMLARKIAATLGMHWWRGDKQEWLNDDYNLLYGGIDNDSVTTRLSEPNGIMVNVAARMASELSCAVTAWDFTRAGPDRTLFPYVVPSYRPEDDNGYVVPEAVTAIRANIRYLHFRLLGETLTDGDPEIERTYQLFVKTYRELARSKVGDLQWDCQGRWDRVTFKDLPQSQVIDNDRNYTIRSWMAVMTYLLSDWKFLYE